MQMITKICRGTFYTSELPLNKLFYIDTLFKAIDNNSIEIILEDIELTELGDKIYTEEENDTLEYWMKEANDTIDMLKCYIYEKEESSSDEGLEEMYKLLESREETLAKVYRWYSEKCPDRQFNLSSVDEYIIRKLKEEFEAVIYCKYQIKHFSFQKKLDYKTFLLIKIQEVTEETRMFWDCLNDDRISDDDFRDLLEAVGECNKELNDLHIAYKNTRDAIEWSKRFYAKNDVEDEEQMS